jgi:hypothetical protein
VLATLAQPDLEPGLVRQRLQPSHARRYDAALVEAHAATQPSQLATAGRAVHLHVIDTLDLPAGMHETLRKSTVVRQQEQAGALQIEPPDRINALTELRHQRPHRRPSLRVRERADDAAGLVQRDGPPGGPARDALAVDGDHVADRIGTGTELPDHRAVDTDAPGTDQLLGAAPRRHAEGAQDLLQPVAQPSRPSSTAGPSPDWASASAW